MSIIIWEYFVEIETKRLDGLKNYVIIARHFTQFLKIRFTDLNKDLYHMDYFQSIDQDFVVYNSSHDLMDKDSNRSGFLFLQHAKNHMMQNMKSSSTTLYNHHW